ncbi:hypothetical protein ACO0LC_19180 [Undibacterium sp. JH2W]|uniref:hypothetical protein n=1 Tax=Undibacterium sp. JH2W TaxID=3413037 RepID=UPI003BF058F3
MGLAANFYIVTDWDYIASLSTEDELAAVFDEAKERLLECPTPSVENSTTPYWCYLYEAEFALTYWKFAGRAGSETYTDVIRPILDETTRVRADACLQALFWHGCDCDLPQQRDLEKGEQFVGYNHGFLVSIRPENVSHLRTELIYLIQRFTHPEMQQALGAAPDSDYTCSWQIWAGYIELWQALLSEANSKNAGILVEAT